MRKKFPLKGFTLVEMMMVIVILGILVYSLSTKIGELTRKSKEAKAKHSLGTLRSTISIYYSESESHYPTGAVGDGATTLADVLVPRYIQKIPELEVFPYFSVTQEVDNVSGPNFSTVHPTENGRYLYISDVDSQSHGTLGVACYHADSSGRIWSSY